MAAQLEETVFSSDPHSKNGTEREKPLQLLSLPVELLSKILEFANWKDILQAKSTCKLIYDVTKSKQFWLNFYENFEEYMNPLPSLPHPLDRDFSSYTAMGLERLLIQSITRNISLPTYNTGCLPISSSINLYGHVYTNIRMIPGGRWVLVADPLSGHVFYYDVQSNATDSNILIPNFTKTGFSIARIQTAVDVDIETGDYLAFTYAIHVDVLEPPRLSRLSRPEFVKYIDVWRITLSNAPGSTLSAEHLSHIPRNLSVPLQPISSLSIRGQFLAYALTTSKTRFSVPSYVGVFNWTVFSTDGKLQKPQDLSEHRQKFVHAGDGKRITFTQIHLLSQHKLLVVGREIDSTNDDVTILRLHDFSSVAEQMNPVPSVSDTPRTFQFQVREMGIMPNTFTSPYFCITDGTVRFVMQSLDSVYGIIIPFSADNDNDPQLITLFRNSQITDFVLRASGYQISVGYGHSDGEFAILQYTWATDVGTETSSSKYQIINHTPDIEMPYVALRFDDASGRLLALGPRETTVFSFSLDRKPISSDTFPPHPNTVELH